MSLPKRRRIRLSPGIAHDPHEGCSVTIAALDQKAVFRDIPFVRTQEGPRATVPSVLDNPVREGLVGSWREYPLSGSWTLELQGTVGDKPLPYGHGVCPQSKDPEVRDPSPCEDENERERPAFSCQ